jgi:hypothetical protein
VQAVVTPPVSALHPAPDAELDLDVAPVDPRPRGHWRAALALFLVAVLVGAASGAVLRTLTAGTPPPALPQAELGFVEGHLDGGTIATLRLTIRNGSPVPVAIDRFEAAGIRTDRVTVPVRRTVPGRGTTAMLLPVNVDCTRTLVFSALEARVILGDGTAVPAVTARRLAAAGGLCRQLRGELPEGWWDPWSGVTHRMVGDNLELTLPPVDPGVGLAGVWVGDTLLATVPPRVVLVGNRYPPFQLMPPDHCVLGDGARMPTGVRILLAGGTRGLRTRYVVIGPDLARWLLRRC